MLFFLDRFVARVAAAIPGCIGGRLGEPSREGLGEAVVDEVVELSRGVVVERLNITGEEEDVCSDRLDTELTRLSLVLSLPSLLLGNSLSLSTVLLSCLATSSGAESKPAAEAMTGPVSRRQCLEAGMSRYDMSGGSRVGKSSRKWADTLAHRLEDEETGGGCNQAVMHCKLNCHRRDECG